MSLRSLFDWAMAVFYLAVGAVLWGTPVMIDTIPRYRGALGAVLFGYGLIRAYVAWRKRSDKAAPPSTPS